MLTTPLPLWALMLMTCLPALSMLLSAALWWHGIRTVAAYHQETSTTLGDITAIAQAIAAQTRELLRRTEP
jgi:hypothetical protein